MLVTIVGINNFLNDTKILEGVRWDDCTLKEINRRNGCKIIEVRYQPEGCKRANVFSSGYFNQITIQNDETGRFLLRYRKDELQ